MVGNGQDLLSKFSCCQSWPGHSLRSRHRQDLPRPQSLVVSLLCPVRGDLREAEPKGSGCWSFSVGLWEEEEERAGGVRGEDSLSGRQQEPHLHP